MKTEVDLPRKLMDKSRNFILYIISACKYDVDCNNGGACENGQCTCVPGFAGANCEHGK